MDPKTSPPAEPDLVDFRRLRDMAGFVLRAPGRHRRLAAAVFAVVTFACTLAAVAVPRSYECDTKIFAQRNLVMPSLGNPRRSVPSDSDAPTRGAAELILNHDNLVAIAEEAKLLEHWEAARPRLLRLKDRVTGVFTPPSEEDRSREIVGLLERKLWVQADEATIRVTVAWHDPEVAFQIVSLAERNFLDGRAAAETSVISETIAILDTEAAKQRALVGEAFTDVERNTSTRPASATSESPAPPRTTTVVVVGPPKPKSADDGKEIAAQLEQKRRDIQAIEEPRQRMIADMRAKLAELRMTYASAHPLVMELENRIDAASVEPPELTALRRDERALLARTRSAGTDIYDPDADRPTRRTVTVPAPGSSPSTSPAPRSLLVIEDSPALIAARTKLEAASRRYEEIVDRIDAAHIELATAKAAFKYRYTVVQPPEVPKKASRPNGPILVVGGILLAAILALFAATARDLAGGRLVESWQARRRLKVPLLAEVNEP